MDRRDEQVIAEVLDLVDAAVYADVFDTAVSLGALHRFGRIEIDRETLAARLTADPCVREVIERDRSGAFTLRGRAALAAGYADRVQRAARLRGRAHRVARVLRHTPFVRGISLTGSVAAADAPADADVDLLVIVADDHISTVFALLGTASRLIGRRWFCPNFYLAESQLELAPQNVYVGRELGQTEGIVGNAEVIRGANPWLVEMFPNLGRPAPAPIRSGSALQRLLEAFLGGRLGASVENRAHRLARSRLLAHYHGEIPEDVALALDRGSALRFHASGIEFDVPALYEERRQALANVLRGWAGRRPGGRLVGPGRRELIGELDPGGCGKSSPHPLLVGEGSVEQPSFGQNCQRLVPEGPRIDRHAITVTCDREVDEPVPGRNIAPQAGLGADQQIVRDPVPRADEAAVAFDFLGRDGERRTQPVAELVELVPKGGDLPASLAEAAGEAWAVEKRCMVERDEKGGVAALGDERPRPGEVNGEVDRERRRCERVREAGLAIEGGRLLPLRPAGVVLLGRQHDLLERAHVSEEIVAPGPPELTARPAVRGLGDRNVSVGARDEQHCSDNTSATKADDSD